jgi:hypothetical protein
MNRSILNEINIAKSMQHNTGKILFVILYVIITIAKIPTNNME